MTVILLAGLPAAGKTHARRELATRVPSARSIDCAAVARAVLEGRPPCARPPEDVQWTPEAYALFEESLSTAVVEAVVAQRGADAIIEATPIFAVALTRALPGGVLWLCRPGETVRKDRLRLRYPDRPDDPAEIARFHRVTYQPALFSLERPPRGWTVRWAE